MTHLSIIGTGNMGQAIAAVAGKGGHTVQLLGQGDHDTAVTGDIVVLAVPYPAVSDVIARRGESLATFDKSERTIGEVIELMAGGAELKSLLSRAESDAIAAVQ